MLPSLSQNTKLHYINIKQELLAVVFIYARFHTYLYSWKFTVKSDHKALDMITLKNLVTTSQAGMNTTTDAAL